MKTSNLSADNFQKVLGLDGLTPEPAIRSSDSGQRIPCFDSCQSDRNIDVQLASSLVPKVVRKCESKHWFSCGADGLAAGEILRKWVQPIALCTFFNLIGLTQLFQWVLHFCQHILLQYSIIQLFMSFRWRNKLKKYLHA